MAVLSTTMIAAIREVVEQYQVREKARLERADMAVKNDPVQWDHITNTWGYWESDWAHFNDGYSTYDDARKAMYEYCMKALGWDTDA